MHWQGSRSAAALQIALQAIGKCAVTDVHSLPALLRQAFCCGEHEGNGSQQHPGKMHDTDVPCKSMCCMTLCVEDIVYIARVQQARTVLDNMIRMLYAPIEVSLQGHVSVDMMMYM